MIKKMDVGLDLPDANSRWPICYCQQINECADDYASLKAQSSWCGPEPQEPPLSDCGECD